MKSVSKPFMIAGDSGDAQASHTTDILSPFFCARRKILLSEGVNLNKFKMLQAAMPDRDHRQLGQVAAFAAPLSASGEAQIEAIWRQGESGGRLLNGRIAFVRRVVGARLR